MLAAIALCPLGAGPDGASAPAAGAALVPPLAAARAELKLPVINLPAQPVMHSAAMLALATTLVATPFPAHAARTIGEIQGSGLVFKDTLKVEAFDDPKVSGVQLYLSDFQRPATEKLAKGDLVRSRLLCRPAPPAPALTACLLVMCDSSATPARAD